MFPMRAHNRIMTTHNYPRHMLYLCTNTQVYKKTIINIHKNHLAKKTTILKYNAIS